MEVRPGYKQTRVGVIPVEWAAEKLGPYVVINSGESPSKYRFTSEGIPYFKVGELDNDYKYLRETPYFIDGSERVPRGSLIFPKRGASIMLNKVRILAEDSFMDTNLMTLTPRDGLDAEYLYYALLHVQLWRVADTTSIPQINNKHIRALAIPIPPMREQRAIASVLSDVDALITALDRLIAKKRAIKRGAMQQLLTGRTRLPGFSSAWEVKTIGETFQFLQTASNSRSDLSRDGGVKYLHYGDIHTKWDSFLDCGRDDIPRIREDRLPRVPFLEDGDLVMADASEDYEGIGASIEVRNATGRNVVAGLHTLLLRGDKKLVADGFKGYIQHIPALRKALIRIATGISVYGISKSKIRELAIELPTLPEQRVIAAVLSDMDAEIAALEARRDKTRALKRGMMQELLTGKTRLI